MIRQLKADSLTVNVYDNRASLGQAAGRAIGDRIRALLQVQPSVNMIFASAPSQNETLAELLADGAIPWERVNAFHMDEYIGLAPDAPQGFGNFIRDRLWGRVKLRSANYIDGGAADPAAECERYADALLRHPIDIVCFGIGENGHLAFNDPHVADFSDRALVKVVDLDDRCRRQQVNDGCFRTLEDVPHNAITLTIPALMAGRYLYGAVPGRTKADAVFHTVRGEIGEHCPATALRRHTDAILFTDLDSAGRLLE